MNPPSSLRSFQHVHAKILGATITDAGFEDIIFDIKSGNYQPVQIAAFLTACSAQPLDVSEIYGLTKAMAHCGEMLDWGTTPVLDKHCVGGLPGNRTTPIVVAIVAAAGLTIPKTSSRAITSAAGTADTMEVLAPVDLSICEMRRVVEQENGCVVWGGGVGLSPADDDLVRVARVLEFDGDGQLIASILSKKIAAGASHVIIDIPVGPTAKIRSAHQADRLSGLLLAVAESFGLSLMIKCSDGSQPVGSGIGPALEARDVLYVLQNSASAPSDLRARAISLAGPLLEIGKKAKTGEGMNTALDILQSGAAWKKFQAICDAQGGLQVVPQAKYTHPVLAHRAGYVSAIDNHLVTRLAKLAGAPQEKSTGLDLHVHIGDTVDQGQPVFTIHANSKPQLDMALAKIKSADPAIIITDTGSERGEAL